MNFKVIKQILLSRFAWNHFSCAVPQKYLHSIKHLSTNQNQAFTRPHKNHTHYISYAASLWQYRYLYQFTKSHNSLSHGLLCDNKRRKTEQKREAAFRSVDLDGCVCWWRTEEKERVYGVWLESSLICTVETSFLSTEHNKSGKNKPIRERDWENGMDE